MSILTSDRLRMICPDDWVARAYGEYLADCAQTQANLLSEITNAITDDTLSALVDTKGDSLSQFISDFKSKVYTTMAESGTASPELMTFGDDEFDNVAVELYANDSDFSTMVDQAISDFPQMGPNIEDLLLYLSTKGVDDVLADDTTIDAALDQVVSTACQNLNVDPSSSYTLNDAYISFSTLIKNVVKGGVLDVSSDEVDSGYVDVEGNTITGFSMTSDEMVEEIKTNFASCVAWAQGFLCLEKENVSAAISDFESQVGTIISDVTEKFAASVAQVKSVISSTGADVKNFLDTASELLGWNQIANDTFTTVNNTDIASYTGASPLAGVNLKTAQGIAAATGKTIAAVACAAWTGLKALANKLWKKVKPAIKAVTNNPIDITIQNDNDESYAIGNFLFNYTDEGTKLFLSPGGLYNWDSAWNEKWEAVIESLSEDWYGLKTYFFELCFRIKNAELVHENNSHYIRCDLDIMYRTRIINVERAMQFGVINFDSNFKTLGTTRMAYSDSSTYWQKYVDLIRAGDFYPSDVTAEEKMYAGLLCSAYLSRDAVAYVFNELYSQFLGEYHHCFTTAQVAKLDIDSYASANPTESSGYLSLGSNSKPSCIVFNSSEALPTNVTNLDFIQACCGYQGPTGSKSFRYIPYIDVDAQGAPVSNTVKGASVSYIALPLIAMLLLQKYDRYEHPTDYLFLPYCKGSYSFSDGKYRIKTDAENANIAQVIVNVVFVIVVIVAAVLICKSILKIRRTKRIAKMNNYMGQCDNAIWSKNKTLSYKEQRKYLRYSRKVDKLTNATSGFLGSDSSSSLVRSGVAKLGNSVIAETNIPATLATGTWTQKQLDDVSSADTKTSELLLAIKGSL